MDVAVVASDFHRNKLCTVDMDWHFRKTVTIKTRLKNTLEKRNYDATDWI
ncbi:hypothetical protein RP20_CCG011167 [Aedes albopictus]|nr:hypothetical protein RP20_CCG011167 [Aedes albopictus]